jgi:hypothetical protein
LELSHVTALDEEGVRIVAIRQHDSVSCYASLDESMREPLRRLLPTAVGVGVEG